MREVPEGDARTIRIAPPRGWGFPNLAELWHARELVFFLIWRDIRVRYKQAVLGIAWMVLQPLATVLVFSLFFGKLLHVPSGDVPYPIFAFAGLVPWTYFATSLNRATGSLVGNAGLLTKVYFPRLAIPLSAVLGGLIDAAIALCVLAILMVFYGVRLHASALLVIPLLVLAAITALGFGLWLGALNVRYRDVGQVVPFLVQVWMYLTPVVYGSTLVPENLRFLLGLNPMTVVVEGFRWALLGQRSPATIIPAWVLGVSLGGVLIVTVGGLVFFRRFERIFADVV
jgi:lipopolysaccharide transport system permease protein